MTERNGVKLGQRARDLDGTDLGRVTRLHDGAFEVARGFPGLFRKTAVVRYDEVRGVRDGALVVARSRRDLDELAAGGLPPSWRIPAPPGFPTAATPAEARGVFAELATAPRGTPARGAEPPPLTPEDELEASRTRNQSLQGAPPVEPAHR